MQKNFTEACNQELTLSYDAGMSDESKTQAPEDAITEGGRMSGAFAESVMKAMQKHIDDGTADPVYNDGELVGLKPIKEGDEEPQQTTVPRVEEIIEMTGLEGERLKDFLISMVQKQFSRVSDDHLEVLMGDLTIGAIMQTIANDLIAVGASQKIIDAIDNVREACDQVVKVCEEDKKDRETQETKEER